MKYLVSSKVYRQLELVAVGSWWLYDTSSAAQDPAGLAKGKIVRIPLNREDVAFSDNSIDIRTKRAVMKFLRFVSDYENQESTWIPYRDRSVVEFLRHECKLPPFLVQLFGGLVLSWLPSDQTTTGFALPRIARHIRSIGRLGPGFAAVIPRWGGLSEVGQVACRAGAVGGAVFMLKNAVKEIETSNDSTITVRLSNNETVTANHVVAGVDDIPGDDCASTSECAVARQISVLSSSLQTLFPTIVDGGPAPAATVVIFPQDSLREATPAVYLQVHNSITGECPEKQCKWTYLRSLPAGFMMICNNTYLHSL